MKPASRCTRLVVSASRRQSYARTDVALRSFSQCIPRPSEQQVSYQSPEPQRSKDQQADDISASWRGKAFAIAVGGVLAFTYRAVKKRGEKGANTTTTPDGFVKYTLVDREAVSSTSSIFTLKPVSGSGISVNDPSLERGIMSVQFKQPQLQIARSYTLLPPAPGQDADALRFLIRKERNGEVSGYLHKLPLGSDIEVRGPSADHVLPADVKRVVFLAGGTGIAPALQTARALAGETDVHVLWANRKREDCVGGQSDTEVGKKSGGWSLSSLWEMMGTSAAPVSQTETSRTEKSLIVSWLGLLKYQASPQESGKGKLTVDYFVDEEGTFITPKDVGKLLKEGPGPLDGTPGKRLLLVSGPEGFINYWAGPKVWANGKEVQGPLAGVLGSIDLKGWGVVKL